MKEFFKDKFNLALIGILILAFIIRIKYFNINTGLWWDEAEYMNMAKHWVQHIPMDLNSQRPPLFPLIIAFLYVLKANEVVVRFITVLLPSLLAVFFTYQVGKSMYTKKIALIASFIMAIFWLLIFNTTRVHTDALALLLYVIAIYLFWQYYLKTYNKKFIWLIGPILALSFLTRLASLLVILSIVIYLLVTERLKFLKNKDLWISAALGLIFMGAYLLWEKAKFGSYLAFAKSYAQGFSGGPAWYVLKFFEQYTLLVFFVLFIIGLLTLYKLFIGFDLLVKRKEESLNTDFFILLWILVPVWYFIFIQKGAEDRWLMIIAPAVFLLASKGLLLIYDFVRKFNRYIALGVVLIILCYGAFLQLDQTKKIIDIKKDSEMQVQLAGKWIKANSLPSDKILSNNVYMELQYASERQVVSISDEKDIQAHLQKWKPKYYVVTIFYQSEPWTYELPSKYPDALKPVQGYFLDQEGKKPAVVIYEVTNYDLVKTNSTS